MPECLFGPEHHRRSGAASDPRDDRSWPSTYSRTPVSTDRCGLPADEGSPSHSMDRTLEDRTSLPQPDFQVQPRSPPYESNKPSTRLYSTSTGAFGVNGVSTGNDTSLASREFSRPPAHLIPAGNRIARRLVILPRSSDFFSTSYNYFSIFSTGKPRDRSTTTTLLLDPKKSYPLRSFVRS